MLWNTHQFLCFIYNCYSSFFPTLPTESSLLQFTSPILPFPSGQKRRWVTIVRCNGHLVLAARSKREMDPCVSQGNRGQRPILRKRQTRKTRILLKSNYLWVFNQVSLALPHLIQRKFSAYVGPNLYLIKRKKEPGQNSKVRKNWWIIYFSPYKFANTKVPSLPAPI